MNNLETLSLKDNQIDDKQQEAVSFCEALTKIRVFSFLGNPVSSKIISYKKTMIAVMKSLTNLDGEAIKHLE